MLTQQSQQQYTTNGSRRKRTAWQVQIFSHFPATPSEIKKVGEEQGERNDPPKKNTIIIRFETLTDLTHRSPHLGTTPNDNAKKATHHDGTGTAALYLILTKLSSQRTQPIGGEMVQHKQREQGELARYRIAIDCTFLQPRSIEKENKNLAASQMVSAAAHMSCFLFTELR